MSNKSTNSNTPKPIGRPRKHPRAEVVEAVEEVIPAKRPPGRPRKDAVVIKQKLKVEVPAKKIGRPRKVVIEESVEFANEVPIKKIGCFRKHQLVEEPVQKFEKVPVKRPPGRPRKDAVVIKQEVSEEEPTSEKPKKKIIKKSIELTLKTESPTKSPNEKEESLKKSTLFGDRIVIEPLNSSVLFKSVIQRSNSQSSHTPKLDEDNDLPTTSNIETVNDALEVGLPEKQENADLPTKFNEVNSDLNISNQNNDVIESTSIILPVTINSNSELTTTACIESTEKIEDVTSVMEVDKVVESATDQHIKASSQPPINNSESATDQHIKASSQPPINKTVKSNNKNEEVIKIPSSIRVPQKVKTSSVDLLKSMFALEAAAITKPISSNNDKIEARVSETVESTTDSNANINSELPILLSKNVQEIEAGSVMIETKFRGNDETKVVVYNNGDIHDDNDQRKFQMKIIQCEDDENIYSICIKIKEANTLDSGKYSILLVSKHKRIILDYNIKIDPKFERCWLTEPAKCIRLPNGLLQLKFGIRSTSNFTTKWFCNDVELKDSAQYRQKVDKREADRHSISLTLQKPQLKLNKGTFVCEVQTEHNTLKAHFNIEFEDRKPKILKEPLISLDPENNTLILAVEYKSELKTTVVWKNKNGQSIDEKAPKPFLITSKTYKSGNSMTQLKLKNYKSSEHSGTYLCEMFNDSGSLIAELCVDKNDESKENGKSS